MSQPSSDRQQSDREPRTVGERQPAEHEEKERGHAQLDQEGKRGHVADGPEERELQRAGLQLGVRVRVRPAGREQLLALVDEVAEVAGIRPPIEVGKAGRRSQDGYPHSGKWRTHEVPHQGRYRPPEGPG